MIVKGFDIIAAEEKLVVRRTKKTYAWQVIIAVIVVLIVSAGFAWTLLSGAEKPPNLTINFLLITITGVVAFLLLFRAPFFDRGFVLLNKEASTWVNGKKKVNRTEIVELCLDMYSSDSMEYSTSIVLKTMEKSVVLLRGLNDKESNAIAAMVLGFLGLDESALRRVYW